MTQTSLFAILATALVVVLGLVAAFVGGTRMASGSATRRRSGPREAVTADSHGLTSTQLELLAALHRPLVVVDGLGTVAWSSAQARALGLVRARDLVHPQLRAMVADELRGGAPRAEDGSVTELVLPRGPLGGGRLYVSVRSSRLDSRLVVLDVEDRSDARRVDEVRRDFVVNVSHELKTPVGAISLLAETMGDAADDPEAVRRFAGRMRQESTRLASLVTDIIELSRVQDVDGLGDATLVDLDEVVRDAVEQVRWRAEEEDIELVLGARTGAQVHGSADLLTTAVRNLLVNAIAYSPSGTRVAAAVRRHEGLVEVLVTDRGIGIPVAEQGRIFERFYRADPARSRQTGGTGLGLAIVKHVAANHGGDASVWSRPGQGSTFTIRLPEAGAAEGATTADPARTEQEVPETSGPASTGSSSTDSPGGTP